MEDNRENIKCPNCGGVLRGNSVYAWCFCCLWAGLPSEGKLIEREV